MTDQKPLQQEISETDDFADFIMSTDKVMQSMKEWVLMLYQSSGKEISQEMKKEMAELDDKYEKHLMNMGFVRINKSKL